MTDSPSGGEWSCGCLGWQDVLALAPDDLTYRQLNYWTTTLGFLTANYHARDVDGRPDRHLTAEDIAARDKPFRSGFTLGWTVRDAQRAARVAQLITTTASRAARPSSTSQIPVELAFRLVDGPVVLSLGGVPHCLTLVPLATEIRRDSR